MGGRRLLALLLAALAATAVAAFGVRGSSATFTAATTAAGNAVTVDALENTFTVAPGTATRPGTSTPVASGVGASLALDFGTVPSARAFAGLFTVRNVTAATQTATLTLTGVPELATVAFASTGTTTATIAPGATDTVTATSSATTAGTGAGTLRLRLGSSTWLYRDYPVAIVEQPEAPGSLAATARPAGAIAVVWTASTTTNLSGYDVYRGGAKVVSLAPGTTSWTDASTTDGTAYAYAVQAVVGGTLASLPSPTANATADATPPQVPTSVKLNGGGVGNGYVNLANRSSVSVTAVLPGGSLASDVVTVTISDGTRSVSGTTAGGGSSVTVSGLDASGLSEGALTVSASAADAAGNVSGTRTSSATKDTVAPSVPTVSYTDNKKAPDSVDGTAEAGAAITVMQTAPSASGPYTGTASGAGAFSVLVLDLKAVTVTYTATATDAAGNSGPAGSVTAVDHN